MTNLTNEEFSGGKISNKKSIDKSDAFRLDDLPQYPAAQAYQQIIENEAQKPINHIFYNLSHLNDINLMVLTDNHWGSISSHFMATINAQLIAKYVPNVFLAYNGDNRNFAINTTSCVSNSLDNALSPTVEFKLWYEVFMDKIIQNKTLFINSGNHENGNRTVDIGTDIQATFFAGTPYFEKYSRFATLITIRLKSNNKKGYEDITIYADHGNGLHGGDGTKLDAGMKLAKQYGARIAIFGHVHQDMMSDYRVENVVDKETGKTINDDLTVVILPATMDSETYALDKRLETPPSDIKMLHIGTMDNQYLLGSTQRERRSLNKTSVYCDCIPIPNELWNFALSESKRLKETFVNKCHNKYADTKNFINQNLNN